MICSVCRHEGEPGPVSTTGRRESLCCQACGASSRHRAVGRILQGFTLANLAVYEVGRSPLSKFLCKCTRLYRVSEMRRFPQLEESMPELCMQDLEYLTWSSGMFDIVICSDVLEHVRLYVRALAELARVLKPGGIMLLTMPLISGDEHREFCRVFDHRRPELDIWQPHTPVHIDPLDPSGCKVYRYYSPPELLRECERGGLVAYFTAPDIPVECIFGSAVLVATKERS